MVIDEQAFERRLLERGLRITSERRTIVHEISRSPSHFDADSLLERLRSKRRIVSRATVYRTLGHLEETGLIRRVGMGQRHARYEPCLDEETHHEHMICVSCGRVLEFVEAEIERLQGEVCRRHRFRPISHSLQIRGVCEDCQRCGSSGEFRDGVGES